MVGLAGHEPTVSHGACDIGIGSFGSCWQGDESHYSTHGSATFNGCSILDWEASLEARSKPRLFIMFFQPIPNIICGLTGHIILLEGA